MKLKFYGTRGSIPIWDAGFQQFGGNTTCLQITFTDTNRIDPRLVELALGADLLIHDAQYTAEEREKRRGWGHSSFDQAMQLAEMAGVRRLALTHHDPRTRRRVSWAHRKIVSRTVPKYGPGPRRNGNPDPGDHLRLVSGARKNYTNRSQSCPRKKHDHTTSAEKERQMAPLSTR